MVFFNRYVQVDGLRTSERYVGLHALISDNKMINLYNLEEINDVSVETISALNEKKKLMFVQKYINF